MIDLELKRPGRPLISFIVAMDQQRLIGRNNELPWHLPADLAFFKRKTMGRVIVMGRKTYESIGKPLPGRTNVIVTTQRDYKAEGCTTVHSVEEVLTRFRDEEEICVIGGSEVFKLFMPATDVLYITWIAHEFEGDTFFPEIDSDLWMEVSREQGVRNEKNPYDYYFTTYIRKGVDI
jgi:dihydrofolate reductase